MATYIETLTKGSDIILPKTKIDAVYDSNNNRLDSVLDGINSNKLSIDGSNLGTSSGTGSVRAVIETYVNGTSGYRIWSDGYCEQWGRVSTASDVTFIKIFKDANYIPFACSDRTGTGANGANHCGNRTTTGMKVITDTAGTWIACGYLAADQY